MTRSPRAKISYRWVAPDSQENPSDHSKVPQLPSAFRLLRRDTDNTKLNDPDWYAAKDKKAEGKTTIIGKDENHWLILRSITGDHPMYAALSF